MAAILPTEHTQNEVEHEEGAQQDERNKIEPRPLVSYSVIKLGENFQPLNTFKKNLSQNGDRWRNVVTKIIQSLTQ